MYGVSIAAAVVGIASTAYSISNSEKQKGAASAAAQKAQQEDAAARARQRNEEEGNSMAGMVASMSGPSGSGGDPATQQFLEEMGYIQPSAEPGGQPQPGQPAQTPNPNGPRQNTPGGGQGPMA